MHCWQFLYFILTTCSIVVLEKIKCKSCKALSPRGILTLYMTVDLMYFCGLKMYTLYNCLGHEICRIFFQVLKKYIYFLGFYTSPCKIFVAISGSENYSFKYKGGRSNINVHTNGLTSLMLNHAVGKSIWLNISVLR